MPTLKSEFVDLAAELFGDEFADFAQSCNFTKTYNDGAYDPVTETTTGGTPPVVEAIDCIRTEYNASQYDGVNIQIGDFKLLAQVAQFSAITPRADNVTVNVDGFECQIVTAEKDPADAVWTIQVRRL